MTIKIEGDPELKQELPKELLSEKKLAESQLEQKRLAEVVNSPFSNKSPKDIERFNAGIIIKESEPLLEVLSEIGRETYAEALATVGRFKDAASVVSCPHKTEFYEAIVEAVELDDAEQCKCNADKVGDKYINPRYVEVEVWSEKHGRQMPVIRCNKCGHRNVRALPKAIADERALRAKVRAHTTGMPHEDAKNVTQQLMK